MKKTIIFNEKEIENIEEFADKNSFDFSKAVRSLVRIALKLDRDGYLRKQPLFKVDKFKEAKLQQ